MARKTYFKPHEPPIIFIEIIFCMVFMLFAGPHLLSGVFIGFVLLDIYYAFNYMEELENSKPSSKHDAKRGKTAP